MWTHKGPQGTSTDDQREGNIRGPRWGTGGAGWRGVRKAHTEPPSWWG